ncbi:MAG TPA: hypothetical protein VMC83_05910 [Streptosporangiaceae bacterium]|nr:hypothetical protein [Streptosporangiaceae bacterium]
MTPMLARSPATAGQATFEPDEDEEEDDDDDEEDEDEELAFSPDFLSPLLEDLSPGEVAASAFLLSDEPFAEAPTGSELFWLARLSVR